MPPSVHRILVHGAKIVSAAKDTIGNLSEEAQEASNKFLKRARASHSRMTTREANNIDTFHHLLITSDPYVNSFRKSEKEKKTEYNAEVEYLLE